MWMYNGEEFTEDMIGDNVGFVYLVVNHTTDMKYVGKKLFTKAKTYQKNKRKRRTRVASDWMTYTGSNATLNEDISEGSKISKTILHLCTSKGWASYYETLEILQRGALQDDKYYNRWISCKIQASHLKGESK